MQERYQPEKTESQRAFSYEKMRRIFIQPSEFYYTKFLPKTPDHHVDGYFVGDVYRKNVLEGGMTINQFNEYVTQWGLPAFRLVASQHEFKRAYEDKLESDKEALMVALKHEGIEIPTESTQLMLVIADKKGNRHVFTFDTGSFQIVPRSRLTAEGVLVVGKKSYATGDPFEEYTTMNGITKTFIGNIDQVLIKNGMPTVRVKDIESSQIHEFVPLMRDIWIEVGQRVYIDLTKIEAKSK